MVLYSLHLSKSAEQELKQACIDALLAKDYDPVIASIYISSLFDDSNKCNLDGRDVLSDIQRFTASQKKRIELAYSIGMPQPGTPIGAIIVANYFEPMQQSHLNAKRVKSKDVETIQTSNTVISDDEDGEVSDDDEILDDTTNEFPIDINNDFPIKVLPDFTPCIESGTCYVTNNEAVDHLRTYFANTSKLVSSITFKSKIVELYLYMKYDLFCKLEMIWKSGIVYGYEIRHSVNRNSTIYVYVSIYCTTSYEILEWLLHLLESKPSTDDFIHIYTSNKTLFHGKLNIINIINYNFIKCSKKLVPIPLTQQEHIIYAYIVLIVLVSVKCKRDLNRSGMQYSGVGPFSMVVFEAAFKSMERAVLMEKHKSWTTDTPSISLVLNNPMYSGHNSAMFAIISD